MGKIINTLEGIGLAIAVICVAAIMFIVSYDAVSRYALHAPLPWAFELITYYLMVAAAFMAVSATFRVGDHIAIELFRDRMSRRVRAMTEAVWALIAALVFMIITWGAWSEMSHAWSRNEFLPGYITWPAWASYLPILLGFALLTLRLVVHAVVLLVHGHDEEVTEFSEVDLAASEGDITGDTK